MNQRNVVVMTLISVFMLIGCQPGTHTLVTKPEKENQAAGHHVEVDVIGNIQPPEQSQQAGQVPSIDPKEWALPEENNCTVSVDFIDRRIQTYNQKLAKWKKNDIQAGMLNQNWEMTEQMVSCLSKLQTIMNGYSMLHDILVTGKKASLPDSMTSEEIQALQESDIDFIEGLCGNLLNGGREVTVLDTDSSVSNPGKLEERIRQSFQKDEYQQVVQFWLEIPEEKVNQVAIDTKLMYGRSLIYLHKEKKAASVYEQVIENVSKRETTNLLYLRTVLADLYMALGNYTAAGEQYQKISDTFQDALKMKDWAETQQKILATAYLRDQELNDYATVIGNYLAYIPSRDGYKPVWQIEQFLVKYPDSPLKTNVDQVKSALNHKADLWFNQEIADIEKFQHQRQFKDGLLQLETIDRDIIGPEQVNLVQRKSLELKGTKKTQQEHLTIEQLTALQDSWDEILTLVEKDNFEDAIARLNLMRDSDYSEKVATKIEEVSLLAAREHSLKAAKLFIRAMQTDDSLIKRQLLVKSYQMLLKITSKYPETLINGKVLGYIERVKSEINKLDPNLVSSQQRLYQTQDNR